MVDHTPDQNPYTSPAGRKSGLLVGLYADPENHAQWVRRGRFLVVVIIVYWALFSLVSNVLYLISHETPTGFVLILASRTCFLVFGILMHRWLYRGYRAASHVLAVCYAASSLLQIILLGRALLEVVEPIETEYLLIAGAACFIVADLTIVGFLVFSQSIQVFMSSQRATDVARESQAHIKRLRKITATTGVWRKED